MDDDGAKDLAPPGIGEQDPNIGLTGGVEDAAYDWRCGPGRGVMLRHRDMKLSDFPRELCGGGLAEAGCGIPTPPATKEFASLCNNGMPP